MISKEDNILYQDEFVKKMTDELCTVSFNICPKGNFGKIRRNNKQAPLCS